MNVNGSPILYEKVFENPDEIVEYALGLDYEPAPNGEFPGSRTKNLAEIAPEIHQQIVTAVAKKAFPLSGGRVEIDAETFFQRIPPSKITAGFPHQDDGCSLNFLCYLTKEDQACGTEIFNMNVPYDDPQFLVAKKQHKMVKYTYSQTKNDTGVRECIETLRGFCTKIGESSGAYNTGISFNGEKLVHAAKFSDSVERLTLITFFYDMRLANT